MTAIRWSYIFTAYTTLFCLGLLDNARGPFFADIMHDLGLNNWQGSLFYATASFMAYFTGDRVARMSKKFGTIWVLRLGQLLMGAGFALVATAHTLPILILFSAVFGLGFGVINVAQNLLVLEASSGPLRRRLFSGLHGMYAFSSLMAPLVCSELFRRGQTWRTGFYIFASTVVVAFILSFVAKNHKMPNLEKAAVDEETANVKTHQSLWGRYFWVVLLLSFYCLAELALTTRLSLYLRTDLNFSAEQASNWLAYLFVGMLLGRLILLFVHFSWPTKKIIYLGLVSSLLCFSLGLAYSPIFLVICGFTLAPIFGLCLDYIAEVFHEEAHAALSYSIAKSCLFIVTMHVLTGFLSDVIGLRKALAFGPLYLLIALFALGKTQIERQNK